MSGESDQDVGGAGCGAATTVGRRLKRRTPLNVGAEVRGAVYTIDEDGNRRVRPYIYTFETFAKKRWLGKELAVCWGNEFVEDEAYFRRALEVNDRRASPSHILEQQELVKHVVHRHELPTALGRACGKVPIVAETSEIVVVDKPPVLPVHPCGSYRLNSLLFLLQNERPDLGTLHITHRLDRLTSGLVTFAKTPEAAREVTDAIFSRKSKKTYLARVCGRFPDRLLADKESKYFRSDCIDDSEQGETEQLAMSWMRLESGKIRVNGPIAPVSIKDSIYEVAPHGKSAVTVIHPLWYHAETDSSLVQCHPITGRTHQLRLHFQFCGHPIANDPCYGGELHFADSKSAKIAKEAQRWLEEHRKRSSLPEVELKGGQGKDSLRMPNRFPEESPEKYAVRVCKFCCDPLYECEVLMQQRCRSPGIWLHALEYDFGLEKNGVRWHFKSPMPEWATLPTTDCAVATTTTSEE